MVHRIDNPSAAAVMPNFAAPGAPGFHSSGIPGISLPTTLDRDWLNMVQEELVGVVTGIGRAPIKGNLSQLFNSICDYARTIGGGACVLANVSNAGSNAPMNLTQQQAGKIQVDATSGALVFNLPAAATNKSLSSTIMYELLRGDTTEGNGVTINCQAGDYFAFTLNNAATYTDLRPGERLVVVSDANHGWYSYRFGANSVVSYGTPGTLGFGPRVGVYRHRCEVLGAAGGGGCNGSSGGGAGGGSGAFAEFIAWFLPGTTVTGSVGTGGTGGMPGVNSGNGYSGSASKIDGWVIANGGGGGVSGLQAPSNAGGMAGTPIIYRGSVLAYSGGTGGDGSYNNTSGTGYGADSQRGNGGRASSNGGTGQPGGYGAGGGGGYGAAGAGGGQGGGGLVNIWEAQ